MVYCVDAVEREKILEQYKYMAITEALRNRIAAGEFPDGKLPSTRGLMAEFGASYGSVRSAILILKTMGVVQGRQGQGVFVTED